MLILTSSIVSFFQVMKGGDLTLTYAIKSPTGEILAEEVGATSVEKTIEAKEDGVYDFCFDNKKSMFAEKVVYFDLGIYDDDQEIISDWGSSVAVDNTTNSEMYSEIVVSIMCDNLMDFPLVLTVCYCSQIYNCIILLELQHLCCLFYHNEVSCDTICS